MNTAQHNKRELGSLAELYERERWLLGETLGRDPRASQDDLNALELRVASIVLDNDFGAYLAEQIKD